MNSHFDVYPWVLKKIVFPQNTDHAGVMWHGSYLSWLEEARISALLKVGLSYSQLSRKGFELPVVNLNIKYKSPLLLGENVLLKSWVFRGKGARWQWNTKFFNPLNDVTAISIVDLVLIKRENQGNRLLRKSPEMIQKAFEDLQNGPLKDELS